MTSKLPLCLLLSVFSFMGSASAVTLSVGNPSITGDVTDSGNNGTFIDLNHPASATGSLTSIRFGWSRGDCHPAGKVRVFSRAGDVLAATSEQAFDTPDISGDDFTVTLSPPLPINQGDLIGIYGSGSCGNPRVETNPFAGSYVYYAGDLLAGSISDLPVVSGGLALSGTGIVSQFRAGVVPAVGSAPGAGGSHIKTSLQMIAPVIGGDVSGVLIFRLAGFPLNGASLPISIPHNTAISFADVVAAMGQTGIGTLEIVLDADSAIPVTVARVFDDQGAQGTTGLGEEMILLGDSSSPLVVPAGFTGYLSAPIDPVAFRFNIGVRTLDSGAFVTYTLKDSAGNTRTSVHASYDPNFFNQFLASDLFGIAPGANDIVEVSVSTGEAIVYGVTIDQHTNDPSAQFVHPVFGVL